MSRHHEGIIFPSCDVAFPSGSAVTAWAFWDQGNGRRYTCAIERRVLTWGAGMFDASTPFGFFDMGALALTLLGLWFAWKQSSDAKEEAARATDAATAAKAAISATESKLGLSQLLVTLGSLQQIISDLNAAAEGENKEVAKVCLVRYGLVASEAALLLEKHHPRSDQLPTDLRETASSALDSKAALARATTVKVAKGTVAVRSDLDKLNLEITTAMTHIRSTAEVSAHA
jgi:hypothetical protein